jgi:hypothetical protein
VAPETHNVLHFYARYRSQHKRKWVGCTQSFTPFMKKPKPSLLFYRTESYPN